jgi:hypothetical protein
MLVVPRIGIFSVPNVFPKMFPKLNFGGPTHLNNTRMIKYTINKGDEFFYV